MSKANRRKAKFDIPEAKNLRSLLSTEDEEEMGTQRTFWKLRKSA